jgi:dTDP-glucose pyrophosphorylase
MSICRVVWEFIGVIRWTSRKMSVVKPEEKPRAGKGNLGVVVLYV